MTALEKLRALPPIVRAPALELLDELTSPLSPREIDRALQNVGYSRGEARRVTKVLKTLSIVALVQR